MTKPTLHLNGTGASDLIEGYRTALDAIGNASEKLSGCSPNARDYYVQSSEAYTTARDEHFDRMKRLEGIKQEILELALHVMEQQQAREEMKRR